MKKLSGYLLIGLIVAAVILAGGLTGDRAEAKKKEKVVYAMAGPLFPEYGECVGLSQYIYLWQGITQTHPQVKGKMNFKIYDKGSLYPNQDETLQAVSSGAVQVSYSGPHYLEALNRAWKLLETPGLISDWDHFQRVMNTPEWQALIREMAAKHNVTILKWTFNAGDYILYSSKGPAKTMADFKGRKIRYPGGEGFAKALKAMGIDGIAMPYTEVVSALQTNMIEGVLTDMPSAPFFQMDKYCTFVNRIPLAIQPICWVVNTKWWTGLDPKVRAALEAPFKRIDMAEFYSGLQESSAQAWRDNPKLTVVDRDPAETAKWQKVLREAAQDVISSVDPKYIQAIDRVRN